MCVCVGRSTSYNLSPFLSSGIIPFCPVVRLELLRAASELVRVFGESLQTSMGLLYPARYPEVLRQRHLILRGPGN